VLPLEPYYLAKYAHIIGVFLFLLAHGSATSIAFRLRNETNRDRIGALLDLSAASYRAFYVAFMLLLGSAIALGVIASFWQTTWFWVALVSFFVMAGVMTPLATMRYARLRVGLGLKLPPGGKPRPGMKTSLTDEEIRAIIASVNPWLLSAVGFGGVAVLAFLMMFKPF